MRTSNRGSIVIPSILARVCKVKRGEAILSIFSERLLFLRHKNGLSQRDCAEKLQISPRTCAYYEAGEREPQLSVLVRIADFYGVSIDYLAGRTDAP